MTSFGNDTRRDARDADDDLVEKLRAALGEASPAATSQPAPTRRRRHAVATPPELDLAPGNEVVRSLRRLERSLEQRIVLVEQALGILDESGDVRRALDVLAYALPDV